MYIWDPRHETLLTLLNLEAAPVHAPMVGGEKADMPLAGVFTGILTHTAHPGHRVLG